MEEEEDERKKQDMPEGGAVASLNAKRPDTERALRLRWCTWHARTRLEPKRSEVHVGALHRPGHAHRQRHAHCPLGPGQLPQVEIPTLNTNMGEYNT